MYEWKNEEELIKVLAQKVRGEIRPGKVKDRKPGDENKMKKSEVIRQTGIDAKAITAIERGTLKKLPDATTLLKLCNAFDCELDYLLGFQEHKRKVIGSVTNITGLSEEAVEELAGDLEFKLTHMELGFDADELGADKFLEYLILNHRRTKLLQRIRHEDVYVQMTREYRKNSRSYQIAKDAYEEALGMQAPNNPVLQLSFSEDQGDDRLEKTFVSGLAGRLQLNEEDVDKWARNEFRHDAHYLYQFLELEQTRAERIRVIEDCFTDLVKDYLKEVEKDAEK